MHAPRGAEPKAKVSIAIDAELLAWAEGFAEQTHTSVSAVIGEAIARYKHNRGLARLLEHLGGADDIPPEMQARVDAELRAGGVIR